jgi:RND family efflux transporter MFP subunit
VDAGPAEPLCVETALVVESVERPVLEVPGNVLPNQKLVVFFKVPGTITEITKDKGDPVVKGDVLARIDPQPYEDAIRQVEAQLDVARVAAAGAASTLQTVTPQLERLEALQQSGVVAQSQVDEVRTGHEQAGAGARAARAQAQLAQVGLEIARTHLADTVITAPFDGVVAERLADVGALAQPMPPTPILVILDINKVRVEGAVSELQFGRVDLEAELEVVLDAYPDQPVPARIAAVMPALDPETRTVQLSVVLDNDGRFRPAMSATLRLPLLPETWTVVPREALLGDPAAGSSTVFVVRPDGTIEEKRVEILDRSENRLSVSGVVAGERVAMTGLQRLRRGTTVCLAGERSAAEPVAAAEPAAAVSPPAADAAAGEPSVPSEPAAADGATSEAEVSAR